MSTMTLSVPTLANDISLPYQARVILGHLEAGKHITSSKAMLVYHISRLSDCVFKLRNAGYDVRKVMREDEVGGKYASYFLQRPQITREF